MRSFALLDAGPSPHNRALAFADRYGGMSLLLACHAAVLARIRPEILALLRTNFLPGGARLQPLHDADVLYGPLCADEGGDFFSMDLSVRNHLVRMLDVEFDYEGPRRRSRNVARFLRHYFLRAAAECHADAHARHRQFVAENLWRAIAFDDPNLAAAKLYEEIARRDSRLPEESGGLLPNAGLISVLEPILGTLRYELANAKAQDRIAEGKIDEAMTLLTAIGPTRLAFGSKRICQPTQCIEQLQAFIARRDGTRMKLSEGSGDTTGTTAETIDADASDRLEIDTEKVALEETSLHEAVRAGNAATVERILAERPDDLETPGWYGDRPLHAAVRAGFLPIVELLLKAGALVDGCTPLGGTPLHIACLYGHAEIARMLLERKANALIASKNLSTPIMFAVYYGHTSIVEDLLACPGMTPEHLNARNDSGFFALMGAANLGHLPLFQRLISAGAEIPPPPETGFSLLHQAAHGGNPAIILTCLSARYPVDGADADGWTALHVTAQHNYSAAARVLLECGAYADRPNAYGWTAAQLAAHWNADDVLAELVRYGADVSLCSASGRTPLLISAANGSAKTLGWLLDLPDVAVGIRDASGRGALELASEAESLDALRLLLTHPAGRRLQLPGFIGTLIHGDKRDALEVVLAACDPIPNPERDQPPWIWQAVEVSKSNDELIALLIGDVRTGLERWENAPLLHRIVEKDRPYALAAWIARGATLNETGEDGATALLHAVRHKQLGAVEVLLSAGVDPDHLANDGICGIALALDLEQNGIVQTLIRAGADIGWRGAGGEGLLHVAARRETDKDVLEALIEAGADLEARDAQGFTPLLRALAAERGTVAKHLIELGADIRATLRGGWRALHLAASRNLVEPLGLLLDRNLDANDPAASPPRTPLQAAAETDAVDAIALLIDRNAPLDLSVRGSPPSLFLAVQNGAYVSAKALLRAGAKRTGKDPSTGLDLATIARGRLTLHARSQLPDPEDMDVLQSLVQHQVLPTR